MSSCSKREFNLSPTSIPLGQAAKYQAESACFLKSVPCGFLLHTYQFGFWVIIKPELPFVHVIFSQSLHHFHLLLQSSRDQEIIYICQQIFVRSVTFHFWGDTTEKNITLDSFALNVQKSITLKCYCIGSVDEGDQDQSIVLNCIGLFCTDL